MRSEEIKNILDKMKDNPEAEKLLKEYGDSEKELDAYSEVAGKLGFNLTVKELEEYVFSSERIRKLKTEENVATIESLPDTELEKVAGGREIHDECKYSFTDKENCWFFDGCDYVFLGYDNYLCKNNYKGKIPQCYNLYDEG